MWPQTAHKRIDCSTATRYRNAQPLTEAGGVRISQQDFAATQADGGRESDRRTGRAAGAPRISAAKYDRRCTGPPTLTLFSRKTPATAIHSLPDAGARTCDTSDHDIRIATSIPPSSNTLLARTVGIVALVVTIHVTLQGSPPVWVAYIVIDTKNQQ